MGRTAQPAALKLLSGRGNGTDSGGRKVDTGPEFRRQTPEPPEWLDDEAKAEWFRVAPELTRLDLLKEEDRATLAGYCETWSRFVAASKEVHLNGVTMTGRLGDIVKNPAVEIQTRAGTELRAYAALFGLSPSSEQNLTKRTSSINEDDNPF